MKEFKMNANNIVKFLDNAEKESMRVELEQKLQKYIKANHGIYYQIMVENTTDWLRHCDDRGVTLSLEPDFTVVVIYDDSFLINKICKKIRRYVENIVYDNRISTQVVYCTLSEYYCYNFKKGLSKKTTIPEKWFDINDQKLSKPRNKTGCAVWGDNANTFIYENNIVYLNVGYVKYNGLYSEFHKYQKRKLFPLFYVDIFQCADIIHICDELKPFDGSLFSRECSLMYYVDKLHDRINNQIHTDKLYEKLDQLKPQMLFFFNYLFDRILDSEQIQFNKREQCCDSCFDLCGFMSGLTGNNTIINLVYTNIATSRLIDIQLDFNPYSHMIKVTIRSEEETLCYSFSITNNIFEYDKHVDTILSKLNRLKFSSKKLSNTTAQELSENTDSDLQERCI